MALSSMFTSNTSPIVADFGSASVKLLQLSSGEKPTVTAAAELPLPDEMRGQAIDRRFEFYATEIPRILAENGFKGRRVVCCPPSSQMFVQHMKVTASDPYGANEQIKTQLQQQLGVAMRGVVVRSVTLNDTQHVVFAIARDDVMRYVEFFKRLKIQIVGVHNELQALLYAFEHINRRASDVDVATLYVDLGWGSTKVVIGHGTNLVFAKSIALGGRHLDNIVAQHFKCDVTVARARRVSENLIPMRQQTAQSAAAPPAHADEGGLAMLRAGKAMAEADAVIASREGGDPASTGAGQTPAETALEADRRGEGGTMHPTLSRAVPAGSGPLPSKVDFSEFLESLADELSMCVRYHAATFASRPIERVIFLGGEARQIGLCQYFAESLRLSAKVGDPLARLLGSSSPHGLPDPEQPHPGWAVACGLCSAPMDL